VPGTGLAAARGATVPPSEAAPFTMKFAPHFGMFAAHAGKDPVAELRFMHEAGFRAVEDNLMRQRPLDEQERIGREAARLGMTVGLISAMRRPNTPPGYKRPQIASGKPADREELARDVRDTVEVAKRVGARFLLVTPGQLDPGVELGYQMANAVETLRAAAKIVEPHGLTMLLEPLNPWANHPGAFVTKSSQLFEIVRAVDSPAFKMLFDIYHLQISEGNLIANIDRCWPAVGYIQTGDVPGRTEPGTGEINYARVFEHIHAKGYRGVVGMEHDNSKPGKDGELAVIAAYRKVDPRAAGAGS
jgi:hydroxypyruvate isomerase